MKHKKSRAAQLPYAVQLLLAKQKQIEDEREDAARTVMKLACVALNDTEGLGLIRLTRFAKRVGELVTEYYADPEQGEDQLRRRLESMGFVDCGGSQMRVQVDANGQAVKGAKGNEA